MGNRHGSSSREGRGQRVQYISFHDRSGRHRFYSDETPSPPPPPHDPWELFAERLLTGPFNISHRLPVNPYEPFHVMMNEEEFWNHGRGMSPGLQHFIRASPIRFSNTLNQDYSGPQLTPPEIETALKKIKEELYTPPQRGKGEEEESRNACSICLEDFFAKQQLSCLPCNHRFHPECLMPWIKRQGQCPVCRLDLTGRLVNATNNNNLLQVNLLHPQTLNSNVADEMALIIRAMEEAFAWLNPYHR